MSDDDPTGAAVGPVVSDLDFLDGVLVGLLLALAIIAVFELLAPTGQAGDGAIPLVVGWL